MYQKGPAVDPKLCLGEAGQISERHHDGEDRGQFQLRVSDKGSRKKVIFFSGPATIGLPSPQA